MTKKCFICGRTMAEHECGDELPEERICDKCANMIEIHVYEWRVGEYWFGYATGKPALVVDGDQSWFEVGTLINGVNHYAQYNETELHWESGEM